MSNMVNNFHKEAEVESDTFPLLCLPDELLVNVFGNLEEEDRETLRSIDNARLNAIEKKTGHRRFSLIKVTLYRAEVVITASDDTRSHSFTNASPLAEVATFFRHASTTELKILGSMDSIDERRLRIAFKTVAFQKLFALVNNDYSMGFIADLVRDRRNIEEVTIVLNDTALSAERAKRAFMALPSMKECNIFENSPRLLIDDDVLLHIVNMTSQLAVINCRNTSFTASGVAKAFEIICNSPAPIQASFHIPSAAFHQFTNEVDGQFIVTNSCFHHEKSGARFLHGSIFSHGPSSLVHMCKE